MSSILVALLIALGSFGGGVAVGVSQQKKKCNKELTEIVKESNLRTIEMLAKIDSLQGYADTLNLKADSLLRNTAVLNDKLDSLQNLPPKVDTLIFTSKEILLNTDTIKKDVRYLKEVLTP